MNLETILLWTFSMSEHRLFLCPWEPLMFFCLSNFMLTLFDGAVMLLCQWKKRRKILVTHQVTSLACILFWGWTYGQTDLCTYRHMDTMSKTIWTLIREVTGGSTLDFLFSLLWLPVLLNSLSFWLMNFYDCLAARFLSRSP